MALFLGCSVNAFSLIRRRSSSRNRASVVVEVTCGSESGSTADFLTAADRELMHRKFSTRIAQWQRPKFDIRDTRDIELWDLDELRRSISELEISGMEVTANAYESLLERCRTLKAVNEGRRVHGHIVGSPKEHNRHLEHLLMRMYAKCGSVDEARLVFDLIRVPNTVSWNIIMWAYLKNGFPKETIRLYFDMIPNRIAANEKTFKMALWACGLVGAIAEGRSIHDRLVNSKYVRHTDLATCVVKMYGSCKCLDEGRIVFDELVKKGDDDLECWNVMLTAYAQNGEFVEVMRLLKEMKDDEGDEVTLKNGVNACCELGDLDDCVWVYEKAVKKGLECEEEIRIGLLKMFGKCGDVDRANDLFKKLEMRNMNDVDSYNAMILAYSENGFDEAAQQLRRELNKKVICSKLASIVEE